MPPSADPTVAPIADLDTLFAAIDAPTRQRAQEDARTRDLEQQQRQAAAVAAGEAVASRCKPMEAAYGEWERLMTGIDGPALTAQLPLPIVHALDAVRNHSASLQQLAACGPVARRLVTELQGSLLPVARFEQILATLKATAAAVDGWAGSHALWIRVRLELAERLAPARAALDTVERIATVGAEEREALAQHQARLAAAASAMPPASSRAPQAATSGPRFDLPPLHPGPEDRPKRVRIETAESL